MFTEQTLTKNLLLFVNYKEFLHCIWPVGSLVLHKNKIYSSTDIKPISQTLSMCVKTVSLESLNLALFVSTEQLPKVYKIDLILFVRLACILCGLKNLTPFYC